MPVKVLLDTDIGSDIDDAVCLAYLLAQPECRLLGITTVSGEADKRAMLASALCKVAGKDVPIFPGTEAPLLVAPRQTESPQAAALARWDHDTEFPVGQAIEFMRRMIRDNPGEVVLLSIGPLTNLALLFRTDPETVSLLKGLVLMCGRFTNRLAGVSPVEWNARCDPHAAAIVYQAAPAIHRSVGLDVTCQVTMNAEQVRQRMTTELLRPVVDFAEVWFRQRETLTFHDPLAAVTLFDDEICAFQRGTVEVELTSPRLTGTTFWKRDASGQHEVALEVDAERFFEHYFSVFG